MSLECKRQQVISGNEVKTGFSSWSCAGAGWHPQPGAREIWDFTVPLMKKCWAANPRGLEGRGGPKRFSLSNKHNSAVEVKPIQSMDREGFLLKIRVKYGIMGGVLKKKAANKAKKCFQQKRKRRMVNSQGSALCTHRVFPKFVPQASLWHRFEKPQALQPRTMRRCNSKGYKTSVLPDFGFESLQDSTSSFLFPEIPLQPTHAGEKSRVSPSPQPQLPLVTLNPGRRIKPDFLGRSKTNWTLRSSGERES